MQIKQNFIPLNEHYSNNRYLIVAVDHLAQIDSFVVLVRYDRPIVAVVAVVVNIEYSTDFVALDIDLLKTSFMQIKQCKIVVGCIRYFTFWLLSILL